MADETEETDPSREINVGKLPVGSTKEAAAASNKETRVADQAASDEHEDRGQARTLRERFSWVVSGLVLLWMVAIYVLLLFQGTHRCFGHSFDLTEKIMLGALGTVTLNVVGLLVIILKFVFPKSP